MIYEVEYDLQWGMRGDRKVVYYQTNKGFYHRGIEEARIQVA